MMVWKAEPDPVDLEKSAAREKAAEADSVVDAQRERRDRAMMATGDGCSGGRPSNRCRGAGDCTNDDDGESGRDKRCRVASGSTGHDDGSSDGTGDDYMDGGSDLYGGHDEETDDDDGCAGWDSTYCDSDETERTKENASAREKRKQSYVVLTKDGVRARQEADTAKVAEVLSIPPGHAAVLLRHFKWQAVRAEDEWFSNNSRIRATVGLPPADGVVVPVPVPVAFDGGRRLIICAICFDGHSAGQMRSAGCAHFYCLTCWRGYIRAAVGDGARCLSLRCPDPACSVAVVPELVDEVADDADRALYARFAVRSYVEQSGGRVRWCPAPGCDRAVEFLGDGDATDVLCDCRRGFCWSCGEEAHRPVSCGTVRAWLAKNVSDSETANWLLTHTKHCPKCRRPIEKNHGCNHMTCGAPCYHQFCWLCFDPSGSHRGCARYEYSGRQVEDDKSAGTGGEGKVAREEERRRRRQAKASLDMYLYHYERWAANHTSLQKVFKDIAELESCELERMAAAVGLPSTELAFMTEAYEQIADGRRVLRWAHAYGYYLDPVRDAVKRALFEDLQDQANSCLERLHGCAELERKEIFGAKGEAAMADPEKFKEYRKKLANLTTVTRTFVENLSKAFETDLAWPVPRSD